ncbi:MAG: hypothetical protein O2860_08965 [Chloroflexi bacterium]|nr:hypothetical protein [Chloroflexota bacterium]
MADSPLQLPDSKSASTQVQRLELFEKWLMFGLNNIGDESGFVVFGVGEDGPYVQCFLGLEWALCEVGTFAWEAMFGAALPDPVKERLAEKGFHPPRHEVVGEVSAVSSDNNYWQELDKPDTKSIAEITEWAFRDVFGETEDFTVEVVNYQIGYQ